MNFNVLKYIREKGNFNKIMWSLAGCDYKNLNEGSPCGNYRVAMTELMIQQEWKLSTPEFLVDYTDVYKLETENNLPSNSISFAILSELA